MNFFVDQQGNLYCGDMQPGDRLATAEEIAQRQVGDMRAVKLAEVEAAYQAAIQLPVSYMGTTFQADEDSQGVLTKSLSPGVVPAGFFWLDINNSRVPMTFPQLQGLAAVMLVQGQAAFDKKTTLKQQLRDASSEEVIQAIAWN